MPKRAHPDQLTFDFSAPVQEVQVDDEDAFVERLVAVGLVGSWAQYDLNKGMLWNPFLVTSTHMPSRMHKFPLQCRKQRVFIVHPGLSEEPFVDEVERRICYRPVYDDCVAFERRNREWQHAHDLCTRELHGELIASAHLTTPDKVADTIAMNLNNGWSDIDEKIGRLLLVAFGIPEPSETTDDELVAAIGGRNTWKIVQAFERGVVRYDRKRKLVVTPQRKAA